MALHIDQKKNGVSLTLELSGKFSAMEAKEFDAAFGEAAQGMKEALLDFSGVEYISSAGLRSLLQAKKRMLRQGGELKVLYPTPDVMEVFAVTRYDNLVTIVRREAAAKTVFYPLRPVQRWMVDTHFQMAQSTMMNTGALIRLHPSLNLELLAQAINDVLAAHDIFRCRLAFHPETGDVCQRFDGEVAKVVVEALSNEAFEARKQEVKQPYELIDHALFRIYLMKTASAAYMYIDFYHAIMDGMSIAILFRRELDKRYLQLVRKDAPQGRRKPSSYAEYVLAEAQVPIEELEPARDYWRRMLEGFDETKHLPPPDVEGEPATAEHEIVVPLRGMENSFFRGKEFSENTFFLAASLLALAKSSGNREAIMGWVHNGRVTSSERRLMGLMLDQFPVRWEFGEDIAAWEFLRQLEAKVQEGMQYRKGLDVIYEGELEGGDMASFILQKGIMGRWGAFELGGVDNEIVEMPANEISAAENPLDIELNARDDGTYSLLLDYDNRLYTERAMQEFAATMERMALALQDETCNVASLLSGE